MKIAIFSGAIPSSTFIEHLIEGVAKYHDVQLFGVIEKKKKYASKSIKIHSTPHSHVLNLCYTLWRLMLLAFTNPRALLILLEEIKKYPRFYDRWIWFSKFLPMVLYKPDIVHFQWARDLDFYYFLKEQFNFKLIVSLRGAHINYTPIVEPRIGEFYRKSFPNIDAFHAVSQAISTEAQNYGADQGKISLIHSPIPSEFFKAYTPVKRNNSETIRIIMVGRFHWIKGYKYAFDALSILKNNGLKIHITIVGPETMTESVNFQVHQLQLQDQVVLKPAMSQDNLRKELKAHDIFLLSSLKEGIANVVLEAMALGLPVVSTHCGGMAEVIMHKETGWLVPVRDSKAIADTMVAISQTPLEELQTITQNAHEFVKTHFNAKNSIQQFLKLYENVINS